MSDDNDNRESPAERAERIARELRRRVQTEPPSLRLLGEVLIGAAEALEAAELAQAQAENKRRN